MMQPGKLHMPHQSRRTNCKTSPVAGARGSLHVAYKPSAHKSRRTAAVACTGLHATFTCSQEYANSSSTSHWLARHIHPTAHKSERTIAVDDAESDSGAVACW